MFAICILSKVNKVVLHMITKISVPLSEIDDQFLQDLKTPTDQDFEPLLSLASRAFKKKTNSSFDYIPPTKYETYANRVAW